MKIQVDNTERQVEGGEKNRILCFHILKYFINALNFIFEIFLNAVDAMYKIARPNPCAKNGHKKPWQTPLKTCENLIFSIVIQSFSCGNPALMGGYYGSALAAFLP